MNNNTSDRQPVSTHPPHCTSCNTFVAPFVGKEMPISRIVIAVPNTTVVFLD
jgi:hypothetical protein